MPAPVTRYEITGGRGCRASEQPVIIDEVCSHVRCWKITLRNRRSPGWESVQKSGARGCTEGYFFTALIAAGSK